MRFSGAEQIVQEAIVDHSGWLNDAFQVFHFCGKIVMA